MMKYIVSATSNFQDVKNPPTGGGPQEVKLNDVDQLVIEPRLGTPGLEGIPFGLEIGGGGNLSKKLYF